MSDKKCGKCENTFRSNAKFHTCYFCSVSYHVRCQPLNEVQQQDSLAVVRQCPQCAIPAKEKGDSSNPSNKNSTNKHGNYSCSVSANSGTTSTSQQDGTLKLILDQITELKMNVDKQFELVNGKLEALDELPQLVHRLEKNEKDIEDVRGEIQAIQRDLDNLKASRPTDGSAADVCKGLNEKIKRLEVDNAKLASRMKNTASVSSRLVIGGLAVPASTDLRALSLAVLQAVNPELQQRDVVSARLLVNKSMVASGDASSVNRSSEADLVTSQRHNAVSAEVPTPHASRPPSILVTLQTRPQMTTTVHNKAKKGKLHTSDLLDNLPATLDRNALVSSLININEFLPSETYRLHRLVRSKAKEDGNFVTYLSGGRIYVRRKRGDIGTLINSEDDLQRFLG